MADKNKKQEQIHDEEDGELTVHQQITESYQSGVIDHVPEGQSRNRIRKEK